MHIFVHKNFLLIKGDRREAWGPFPHVWAVTTWEWRPRWRPCRCPRRYAAVVLAKVPRVEGGGEGGGEGAERGCSLLPCLREEAPLRSYRCCMCCTQTYLPASRASLLLLQFFGMLATIWILGRRGGGGGESGSGFSFWGVVVALLKWKWREEQRECSGAEAKEHWLPLYTEREREREREREADLQRFCVMDLRQSDQGKGAG
jgi:hypothetical protein